MPTSSPPTAPATPPRTLRARLVDLLALLWMVLLILPAASSTSSTAPWDIDPWMLFGLSCWLIVAARLVLPGRWFFPLTLPVALLGVACMGADFLRHADLLDLGTQWRTFSAQEVRTVLEPYALATALALAVLAAWCVACARAPDQRRGGRRLLAAVAVVTAALAVMVPGVSWVRAWPLNGVLVAASALAHSDRLLARLQPALSRDDPRDPHATWHGRATNTAARQTLVFIVGESVRADYLRECGGPDKVRAVAADALVACDVTSGSDATHTSVPLLISRDMPGRPYRVSADATFLRAFEEAGFETHWIGDQGKSLAWPDAQFQAYPEYRTSDEAALGPPLAQALARPAPRKALVLHAYNAHDGYCGRFDPATAPYKVDCARLNAVTGPADAAALRLGYADAIDASIGWIDGVIDTLRREPGEAFLLFTPDHGENLYDDSRQLYEHALRTPTRWDTHVPAIFWANAAWRQAHPRQWANLQAQVREPLMHADMVPTFLAAGGVRYDDARPLAIDLLDARVPRRTRTIERGLGRVVDWDTLVREAR
ncbi:MAG TPA: sulfatase-like hydrolase/transferase [Burkholderiaceae bacterium]